MLTEFRGISSSTAQWFLHHYREQFSVWAHEFRLRGSKCAVIFESLPGRPVILDAEGRPVQRGVWLEAELDRDGIEPMMIIRPATENDGEMIERHCREMKILH